MPLLNFQLGYKFYIKNPLGFCCFNAVNYHLLIIVSALALSLCISSEGLAQVDQSIILNGIYGQEGNTTTSPLSKGTRFKIFDEGTAGRYNEVMVEGLDRLQLQNVLYEGIIGENGRSTNQLPDLVNADNKTLHFILAEAPSEIYMPLFLKILMYWLT